MSNKKHFDELIKRTDKIKREDSDEFREFEQWIDTIDNTDFDRGLLIGVVMGIINIISLYWFVKLIINMIK